MYVYRFFLPPSPVPDNSPTQLSTDAVTAQTQSIAHRKVRLFHFSIFFGWISACYGMLSLLINEFPVEIIQLLCTMSTGVTRDHQKSYLPTYGNCPMPSEMSTRYDTTGALLKQFTTTAVKFTGVSCMTLIRTVVELKYGRQKNHPYSPACLSDGHEAATCW